MDFSEQELKYGGLQLASRKKPRGLAGAAVNFLPTIGGAIGAVGGSVVAPIAGTAAGGAVGAGLGEYLRQKLTGEADDGIDKGNIVQEGVFGSLPGVVKGTKALRGAKGAVAAANKAQTTEAALRATAKQNRLTKFGTNLQADARGTAVGTKVSKNTDKSTFLQPKTAKAVNADIDTLPGKTPAEKLGAWEVRQAEAGKRLGETVTSANRPTSIGDLDKITARAGKQSKKIQGWDAEIASDANKSIAGAKDLDELYALRKDLDGSLQSFYKAAANDSSATAKAKTLKAYRDGIDEVLADIPGFKEANRAYAQGLKTQDVLNRAANKKNDIRIFGVNTGVGGEGIAKTKEAVGGVARKAGGAVSATADSLPGYRPFMGTTGKVARAAVPQAGYRVGASMFTGQPYAGDPQAPEEAAPLESGLPDQSTDMTSEMPEVDNSSPFSPANVEANVANILANGGTMKDVSEYLTIAKTIASLNPKEKPMSAEASKTRAGATAGLENLDYLEQIMQEQPSDRTKTAIPGRGIFSGLGNRALGTDDYEAARQNIIDSWARIKTGAAISKDEERRFKENLPQAFDSERAVQMKMQTLRNLFTSVAGRAGSAGTDLEAAIGSSTTEQ